MNYTIEVIANIIQANYDKVDSKHIRYILTDSRTVYYPSESLFFALETSTNDGHKYIEELVQKGVQYFVVHKENPSWKHLHATFLVVKNTLDALQQLAAFHRVVYNIPIVGITGSNGKTIVKEWLHQLLQSDYHLTRSPKSYNSQVGVPLSICLLDETTEIGIFEAGISQPHEMQKLQHIIQPNIGIFTTLGQAHQENFSSMEEKLREKLYLFSSSKVLICKYNHAIEEILRPINPTISYVSWSFSIDDNPTILIQSVIKKQTESSIRFCYQQQEFSYTIPFVDDASIENSIHCLAFCLWLSVPIYTIIDRMKRLEPIAMRLEKKQGTNNCLLINDSYNSDINSLHIALDLVDYSAENTYDKRTVILSDIIQSGEEEHILYSKVAKAIQQKNISRFIGIGKHISQYAHLFEGKTYFYHTTKEFLFSNIIDSFHNEAILVKGARSFEFEKIINKLELKMHETVLEVNLNALVNNFNYLRSYLLPSTKTMCMIKANAYGCGAIEVAKTLQYHRCDYFGVAVADEGVELRKAGIHTPIIVMNPEPSSFDLLCEYRLEPEIYSFKLLKAFAEHLNKYGIINYPIHIKIDTGMKRLGFEPTDMNTLIHFIKAQTSCQVQSIFTHLVGADDAIFDDFTQHQLKLFTQCCDVLQSHCNHPIIRHALNSAGVERFPNFQFDMVRLGIGLYGIATSNQHAIQPLVTLKTIVLQVKNVAAHETVGYSRKGSLHRNSRIATIPIGYADGLKRNLGNGNGYVLIDGKKAPFVGNICMDISMVDITDIPHVEEGDTVVVIGNQIHINEIAEKAGTIPYEILTGISQRVKRIYFQE